MNGESEDVSQPGYISFNEDDGWFRYTGGATADAVYEYTVEMNDGNTEPTHVKVVI